MNPNQIATHDGVTGAQKTSPSASQILQNLWGKSQNQMSEQQSFGDDFQAVEPTNDETVTNRILTRLDEKKEQAAVNLGIGANEVETMPFDLSALETEGIFLNIDARGFGALQRQLEWKTLGVELPAHNSVSVSPPRAGLLPDYYRKKLHRGAAQAHNALNKFSFRFTLCETVWGTSEYK